MSSATQPIYQEWQWCLEDWLWWWSWGWVGQSWLVGDGHLDVLPIGNCLDSCQLHLWAWSCTWSWQVSWMSQTQLSPLPTANQHNWGYYYTRRMWLSPTSGQLIVLLRDSTVGRMWSCRWEWHPACCLLLLCLVTDGVHVGGGQGVESQFGQGLGWSDYEMCLHI